MKACRNLISALSFAIMLPASVQAGALADLPLSLKGGVPPNVLFALSVEFPTANTAAYQGTNDYSANNEYLGYFDPDKCYLYDSTNGWFYPSALASNRACSTSWSGNFLNWATMTGLDEFRYAMTGGNRSTDTATLTVLERSYQSGQGGTSNFPDKTFTENGSTTGYPSGTALRITNQGMGIRMSVTPTTSGTDVANCSSPGVSGGVFSCGSLTLASDGTSGTCTTWSGSGTVASPYQCTSFGAFGGATPSSATVRSTSSVSTGGSSTTVSCSNPTLVGSNFHCDLTMSDGSTGTCSSWTGDGTTGSPYKCTSFATFSGNKAFVASLFGANASFNAMVLGSQNTTGQMTCTVNTNAATNQATDVTCNMPNGGGTATCTSFSKASGNKNYDCLSYGFSDPNKVFVSASRTADDKQSVGGFNFYYKYSITYQTKTLGPVYYVGSYGGAYGGSSYTYVSAYDLTFGATATYNVRVKVCDSSIGLESNCKQYGTSWKPTGSIQERGDKMRFGVLSYFNANDIDNAVLRSKLKYVGPDKYSSSSTTVTNPSTEWSATDGTFITDPDASDAATKTSFVGSAANTGVINYINKFGKVSQNYKTYDNVGKLYYEALNYLRGRSATADFYRGAKPSNSDGFPVISTWDDPVQYTCQKNYIVTMGDTHTWCDKRLPGGTYGAVGSGTCNAYTDGNSNSHVADYGSLSGDTGVNVTTETNSVGSLEGMGNIATSYTGAGGASYSMAGLAKWAASSDIRSDLVGKQTVQTYVIDVHENKDCGYRSQYWLAAKYGVPNAYDDAGTWLTTANPAMGTLTLPAGLCASRAPAGYSNSGGPVAWPKNLLRAGDPFSMIASVKAAFEDIAAQTGDEAALSQSAGSLDTGTGAYIYRANYNTGGWTGDVVALNINTSGVVSSTPAWKASAKLPAAASRNIYTFNDGLQADGTAETTTNSRKGVAFTAAGLTNLSSGQQAALDKNDSGTADSRAAERINWLRGDQSKEANLPGTTNPNTSGYGWRSRSPSALLGDVINSNPVFVGAPSFKPGSGYATFASTNANRKPMIYVGGNDGMLHGYDASYTLDTNGNPVTTASSGTELLAYVPSSVFDKLSQLMSPNYSHKYYVDGSPVVEDACFGNTAGTECTGTGTTSWKTVLVGGLNAGGQGVYALDVTDPSNFNASKVLWEFTDKDDADLGYTFSKPIIAKLNNKKWAVIFGNGYNNTFADTSASATGRAYLYILYIDGPGAGNAWTLNTNYFKIELKSPSEGGTLPLNPANGLSSVSGVDKDLNGTIDYIYAGDRYGNVWKVDLASATHSNWRPAFGTTLVPQPLFTATKSTSGTQQITTGIEITKHPVSGYMVMFGTGSWIDTADPIGPFSGGSDSFYGIWDKDDGTTRVASRSSLQKQKIITSVDKDGNACTLGSPGCYIIMSNCTPNYSTTLQTVAATPLCPADIMAPANTGQQFGYVFDLPGVGERTRSTYPKVQGGVVTFTTLTPSTNPCTGNTIGLEYNLSSLAGGATAKPALVIEGSTTGLIEVTIGGQTVLVAPSGSVTPGGASDNGVLFNAKPPAAVVPVPAVCSTIPALPSAACTGAACSNYIPGWGFLANLQGPTSLCGQRYQLSCQPPEFGGGSPVCSWKTKNQQQGRLGWKQIQK